MGEEFGFLGGRRERQALQEVLQSARAVRGDSKWQTFCDLIEPGNGFREAGERVLVFTQYRVTQSWLAAQLEAAGEVVCQIHGGMSLDERKRQRTAFENEATVMISTEAGSEGANLHRGCHLMVNYDLPWNPMRLLQRIGRLDRYGQKYRVRVANLKAPESWDARISAKIEAKLAAVQERMGLVADEDYRSMILGGIHEAIDVAQVMRDCGWSADSDALDAAVDEAVQSVLNRKSSLDAIFRESLGMPANYGESPPALNAEAFRQAFAWAAAAHDIVLRESRTSNNQYLKGVYHFTLPGAFRSGLRASRDCHLVFDRDRYAEIRGATLGRVRGQEIKPMLAGFGDSVTDWFFRGALQADGKGAFFVMQRPEGTALEEAWWVIYAARWKTGKEWVGPDAIFGYGLDAEGHVERYLESGELFEHLSSAVDRKTSFEAPLPLPNLSEAVSACKMSLRKKLDGARHGRHLQLWPLCLVALS